MAKKKINYLIPGILALVLGIAAFCMMFLPAVNFTAAGTTTEGWTGAQIAFGYKEDVPLIGEVTILNFNFTALLAFALPLVGGILALFFKNGLIGKIVTTALFVIGAVLLFSFVAYSGAGRVSLEEGNILEQAVNSFLSALYDGIDSTKSLAAGPIVGGILAVIGAAVCFFKGTIAKLFSK